MTPPKQESYDQEDILLDALESIKPEEDEFINRRINHINFARIIFWLCVQSRKNDFFYVKELSKFIKLSIGRTHHIINEIIDGTNLLKKRYKTDILTEISFEKDSQDKSLVWNYFDKAKKTLGLKFSLK